MSIECCNRDDPTLLSRVRQSMLCGVYGSLVFSVSAMSYLQASVYLRVCGKYLTRRVYDAHMRNRDAAKRNMVRGAIPALEMFIIMPVLFYALHVVLGWHWIYCLMACWATMFVICMAVRLLGIVKNCPDFEKPIYCRGYPFPMMKNEDGNWHDSDDDFERKSEPAMHIPKLTAYLLGFAFLGFRVLCVVAYVFLCVLELVCAPFTFLAEFLTKLCNLVKDAGISRKGFRESYNAGLDGLKERGARACALLKAAKLDLLWVASFGFSGATHLKDATLFWDEGWVDLEPEVRGARGESRHKDGGDQHRAAAGGSCCRSKQPNKTLLEDTLSSMVEDVQLSQQGFGIQGCYI